MNIAVVVRQVPDLIEPLEVDSAGTALDLDAASFILNESDDHALEQALLLKEAGGGSVTVVALDFGDVDNTLYTAAAKGADKVIKIPYEAPSAPQPATAAAAYAAVLRGISPDLVLVGTYAHDELESTLGPQVASRLGLPFVGVVRGVQPAATGLTVCKEFPGAALAKLTVKPPAVLGILGAEKPPRYVPVSRIRAAQKTAGITEEEADIPAPAAAMTVERLYPPAAGKGAEMLAGSADDVAAKIVNILKEKGVVK